MSTPHDGGPAFPGFVDYRDKPSVGMSLRDWFAGQALAGFCGNPSVFAANGMTGWGLVNCDHATLAAECRDLADAVIAELEHQP